MSYIDMIKERARIDKKQLYYRNLMIREHYWLLPVSWKRVSQTSL